MRLKSTLILSLVLMGICPSFLEAKATKNTAKPSISISVGILPFKNLLEEVVSPYSKVDALLKKNQMPEDLDVSMDLVKKFTHSDLYFSMNLPFEQVLESKKMLKNENFIHLEKAVHLENFSDTMTEAHLPGVEEESDDDLSGLDPHIWMSPLNMIRMLNLAVKTVMMKDPAHKAYYKKNLSIVTKKLTKMHQKLLSKTKSFKNKSFVVFHPALGYFAKDYGLKQIAIEKEGKAPSIKELQQVIRFIQRTKVEYVFLQTQYPDYVLKSLKEEAKVHVVSVNPLGEDYFKELSDILGVLEKENKKTK